MEPTAASYVFLSMDPVHNTVHVYSPEDCKRMSALYLRALASTRGNTVSIYLGARCFNATVHLKRNGECYQTTPPQRFGATYKPGGYRSVVAVPLFEADFRAKQLQTTVYSAMRHKAYHFIPPRTAAARADADGGDAFEHTVTIPAAYLQSPDDAHDARVPLWQWNRHTHDTIDSHSNSSIFNVSDEDWQPYSTDVNAQLTAHFDADGGDRTPAIVEVGCRTYEIHSLPGGLYARQVDAVHRKMRLVRRIYVSPAECAALRAAAVVGEAARDGQCALCFDDFASTREMPATALPCGHAFHATCIQSVADTAGPCPLCRSPVADWGAVMAACRGSVGTSSVGR